MWMRLVPGPRAREDLLEAGVPRPPAEELLRAAPRGDEERWVSRPTGPPHRGNHASRHGVRGGGDGQDRVPRTRPEIRADRAAQVRVARPDVGLRDVEHEAV